MLLRKIEGGPTGRLCDTLMIAESANFKKHPLLSPTPIESTPKEKSYPSLRPQLLCGKLRNKFHLKRVPWPFVGFHLDSPHFITYQITLTSHTLLSLLFSSVFFLFIWFFLFDNFFLILLLISRDMQICPKGCNVIICGSGRDICWLCSFKTVHFLDWYLYPTSLCSMHSFKNYFVVTDAFIFYKRSWLWWMIGHRFSFFFFFNTGEMHAELSFALIFLFSL